MKKAQTQLCLMILLIRTLFSYWSMKEVNCISRLHYNFHVAALHGSSKSGHGSKSFMV